MLLPSAEDRAQGRAPLALLLFLALITSLVALTIDAVLPALDGMDRELQFASANDRHFVVLAVFAGLAPAQALVGPLADAYGRKRVALAGLALYLVAALIGALATSPEMLIAARFLQGVGAAGPRVVSVAIARDLFEGRAMARVVSLVNTIFMAVPMLAPLIGQGLEALGGWRAIFGFYAFAALAAGVWYLVAMPETLSERDRRPLALSTLFTTWGEVLRCRQAVVATAIIVAVFGAFTAYLATAQQIFEELYDLGPLFPLAFASLALAFAAASFINGKLVMRLGMRRLTAGGIALMIGASAAGTIVAIASAGVPPLWVTLALLALVFVAVAIVFGNMVALGTAPLGHAAGTATAFMLAVGTLCAAGIGTVIAQQYDGSPLPLFAGFAILGVAALALFGLIREEPQDAPA
ncbi:MAG: multidrug effflux MFS transporter [Pseudomonadota bacterium]